ncbi:MAG TPA: hypothetical protein VN838_05630 [Bradyrhizobium sp.]|nr:hypothetical protein [Bradyrhizobium sp.]
MQDIDDVKSSASKPYLMFDQYTGRPQAHIGDSWVDISDLVEWAHENLPDWMPPLKTGGEIRADTAPARALRDAISSIRTHQTGGPDVLANAVYAGLLAVEARLEALERLTAKIL